MSAGGDMHRVIASLYKRRLAMNLSLKDVADKIGVTRAAVGNWEAFHCQPAAHHLFQWAAALGMSLACVETEASHG